MSSRGTHIELESMTDEGAFEDLAMSVLRIADPLAIATCQTGLNASGKTHPAPLDGIGFVPGANPPHLVAVHHTITSAKALRAKWLYEPHAGSKRGSSPLGDVVKTIEIVRRERRRMPDLQATLILTTNREPPDNLLRDAKALGHENGLEVTFWSGSRLAHVLDTSADGQTVRRRILGTPQDRLSRELLQELSRKSLAAHHPLDDAGTWVKRAAVAELGVTGRKVTFVVGASGSGKTVAAYQALKIYIDAGGPGLILPHQTIDECQTLTAAVETTLRALHPTLARGQDFLSLLSKNEPLIILVEDINRSGDAARLARKLVGWGMDKDIEQAAHWRILCPLWPQAMASLDEQGRKLVEQAATFLERLTTDEARLAVKARAIRRGLTLSDLEAEHVSDLLGGDPLLIALYDFADPIDPTGVIGRFVENAIQRLAQSGDHLAPVLRARLEWLGGRMLARRTMAPRWADVEKWASDDGISPREIAVVAQDGAVFRLGGPSNLATIEFRHDRVREFLLIEAAAKLLADDNLSDDIVGDPAYAEIIGGLLTREVPDRSMLDRLGALNPLALFDAYRRLTGRDREIQSPVVQAIDHWLDAGRVKQGRPSALDWAAAEKLAQTDGADVIRIVKKLGDMALRGAVAGLRNGDLRSGVYLCHNVEPSVGAVWRDRCIEHARSLHGATLKQEIKTALLDGKASRKARSGLLRLAGHWGEPDLADSIWAAWSSDTGRLELLADYIWAATQCADDDGARLGPMYDAWARLPDKSDGHKTSERYNLGAYSIRWAFGQKPPKHVLDWLIARSLSPDLDRHLLDVLEVIDDPRTVVNEARVMAELRRKHGSNSYFMSSSMRNTHWQRQQEAGKPMSKASRTALVGLWASPSSDEHLAKASFDLWAVTMDDGDLALMASIAINPSLIDAVLKARLARRDMSAVPDLLARLEGTDAEYWWHHAPPVWCPALTVALDAAIARAELQPDGSWAVQLADEWKLSEMVTRLEPVVAEDMLNRHWGRVGRSTRFIQAALHVATPKTQELAADSIAAAPEPSALFELISSFFGHRMVGHPGITRKEQLRGLVPYLSYMKAQDLEWLAEACNELGWYDVRREVFDANGVSGRAQKPDVAIVTELEEIAGSERSRRWADFALERILETGVTWEHLVSVAQKWSEDVGTDAAVIALADVIKIRGRRTDLRRLPPIATLDGEVQTSVSDVTYTVLRRSLD